ncbi:MAG: UMP kinase, partial [Myxococcota bacterium]
MKKPVFKRVVLKFSGEALAGSSGYGLDARTIEGFCEEL